MTFHAAMYCNIVNNTRYILFNVHPLFIITVVSTDCLVFILLDKMHSLFQLLVWIQPRELLLDIRGTSPGDNHSEYVRIQPPELLMDIRGTSPGDNHSEYVWVSPSAPTLDIIILTLISKSLEKNLHFLFKTILHHDALS